MDMENRYIELIKSFKTLEIEDKKKEIMSNSLELLKLLYYLNKQIDINTTPLPILSNYKTEDEYFDSLFTIIISLKEENAKLIEKYKQI